jgi:plastocyanin
MRHSRSNPGPDSQTHKGGHLSRRTVLAGVTTGVTIGLTGCTSGILDDPSFPEADVIAAPNNELIFEPDELTVAVGNTVRWGFANDGHNLSCRPEDAEAVILPDSADPFASYGPDQSPGATLVSRGETYEHTFEVTGTYTYVCIPHVDDEMVGTIRVE